MSSCARCFSVFQSIELCEALTPDYNGGHCPADFMIGKLASSDDSDIVCIGNITTF